MPSTDFAEYIRSVRDELDQVLLAGEAVSITLQVEPQSSSRGFYSGEVLLPDRSLLILREFIDLTQQEPRLMYVYHCQDEQGLLRFRYDNAAHRPALSQTSHKHEPTGIVASEPPSLSQVLSEAIAAVDVL